MLCKDIALPFPVLSFEYREKHSQSSPLHSQSSPSPSCSQPAVAQRTPTPGCCAGCAAPPLRQSQQMSTPKCNRPKWWRGDRDTYICTLTHQSLHHTCLFTLVTTESLARQSTASGRGLVIRGNVVSLTSLTSTCVFR